MRLFENNAKYNGIFGIRKSRNVKILSYSMRKKYQKNLLMHIFTSPDYELWAEIKNVKNF